MPPEGVVHKGREEILTFEEIERVTRLFAGMGITKIRITGGEPLVRAEVPSLVKSLVGIPAVETVAMTTNATLLRTYAGELRKSGLTHLNISLDTLHRDRFEEITLRDDFERVMDGIEAALEAGFERIKLNVVVMGGVNDDELCDFVEYVRDKPIDLRFIEFMPFDSNGWQPDSLVPYARMRERLEEEYELVPIIDGGNRSNTAKEFRIPGVSGSVGFITSMTDDFCGDCDRVRLTADGSLKSCLFFPPEDNLRDLLRSGATDDDLEDVIRRVIHGKKAGHAAMDDLIRLKNQPMIVIGG